MQPYWQLACGNYVARIRGILINVDFVEQGLVIALGAFLGVFACFEFGYRFGRASGYPRPNEGVGGVEASVLALLGLLLGFSFAGASTRFDERVKLIVAEANAIGTANLRLELLRPDAREQMRGLFHQYVDQRLKMYRDLAETNLVARDSQAASQLQTKIWSLAVQSANSDAQKLLLLPALNEMFDITTTRTAVLSRHIPNVILGLLIGVALLSGLLAGHSMSSRGKRSLPHMLVYAFAVAATIYVVVDLDHPRSGLIRLDAWDRPLTDLRQTL